MGEEAVVEMEEAVVGEVRVEMVNMQRMGMCGNVTDHHNGTSSGSKWQSGCALWR